MIENNGFMYAAIYNIKLIAKSRGEIGKTDVEIFVFENGNEL